MTDQSKEPCGNKDCDLCYPLPRWYVTREVHFKRNYFSNIKAATLEDAGSEKNFHWGSYSQSPVGTPTMTVEPLSAEDAEWYAETAIERCFHTIRKNDAKKLDRFPRPVICQWCGNTFRSIGMSDEYDEKQTQGDDCAASVWTKDGEWYVSGCYGSSHCDMQRLRFIANHPTEKLDPVCDQCIKEREAAGDLVRVSDEEFASGPVVCLAVE